MRRSNTERTLGTENSSVEHRTDGPLSPVLLTKGSAVHAGLSSLSTLWAVRLRAVDGPSDACSTGAMHSQQWLVKRSHIDFGRVWSCSC
ncbi:hypothetical protein K388_05313 [Streptomyces sp. KhCrAH-43]|nr:hypothetical protein K388_05313 [Streptomyces sp. KhCrAH-43]